jgi:hypothetical protein
MPALWEMMAVTVLRPSPDKSAPLYLSIAAVAGACPSNKPGAAVLLVKACAAKKITLCVASQARWEEHFHEYHPAGHDPLGSPPAELLEGPRGRPRRAPWQ